MGEANKATAKKFMAALDRGDVAALRDFVID